MRRAEILGLTWDRVDLKNRTIKLEAKHTKGKKARNVPIMQPLYDILKALPRGLHEQHVFLYNGKPIRGTLKPASRPPVKPQTSRMAERSKAVSPFTTCGTHSTPT
jgi:integrase